jgi:hypothetical protein
MFDAEVLSEHLSEKVRKANSETSEKPLTHGAHFWLKGKYLISTLERYQRQSAEATSFVSGPFALLRLLTARNIRDSSQSRYFRKAEIVADK